MWCVTDLAGPCSLNLMCTFGIHPLSISNDCFDHGRGHHRVRRVLSPAGLERVPQRKRVRFGSIKRGELYDSPVGVEGMPLKLRVELRRVQGSLDVKGFCPPRVSGFDGIGTSYNLTRRQLL